ATASAECKIVPFASAKNTIAVQFTFKNGDATAFTRCTTSRNGSVKTTVSLQKQVNGKWVTAKTASDGKTASASVTAVKGVTYRAHAVGKFYDSQGKYTETMTKTSPTQTMNRSGYGHEDYIQ
ncbi:MAG: hypothetical protein RR696_13985, partial [Clostridia bacterium]